LWDLSTGKQVLTFERDTDWLLSADVSRDGKWFVTGDGNTAQLFDLTTGKKVRTFEGHTDKIRPVVLSPDGNWLVTAGWDGTIRLWDLASGQQVRVFKGHTDIVHALALSGDNKTLASVGGSSTRLWNLATGQQLRAMEGNGSGGLSVLLSPNGKWLAAGGCGTFRTLRVWDLTAEKEPRVLPVRTAIWSLACSRDSKWLATGGGDPQFWELASGEGPPPFRDPAPLGTVHSVAMSRNDTRLITTSEGGEVRLWEVKTGKVLCRMFPFRNGTWVAVDAENRYDSPAGKDVEGVTWKVGERSLPLSHFRASRYDPGLLAKHLGWNKEPLR
jgi:WD40 repeat protein